MTDEPRASTGRALRTVAVVAVAALFAAGCASEDDAPEPESDDLPSATTVHEAPTITVTDEAPVTSTTTTTLAPIPQPLEISDPLTRCVGSGGHAAAGFLAVLSGTERGGLYEPVVSGGDGSCERIKVAWDEIRQTETARANEGHYPCEYPAVHNDPQSETQTDYRLGQQQQTGAILVGCWPRLLTTGPSENRLTDPDAEAHRLWNLEGFWILPPNDPLMVSVLYDCYQGALEGPPPDWDAAGDWFDIPMCNSHLRRFGNPVRDFGVSPACAANMYALGAVERQQHGHIFEEYPYEDGSGSFANYAGSYSWAACPTTATQLLANSMSDATYSERCEAVVDAAANEHTDTLAANGGTDRGHVLAIVKSMFCEDGTRQTIRDNGHDYQAFVPDWHDPYGGFVALWMPPEGSVCYESAMLSAAARATRGTWARVLYC